MTTLFQFIMYMIFGKRWIKWDMLQGLKMAIFVNEMEIDMDKAKYDDAVKRKETLEKDLAELLETPLADPLTLLSDEEKEDKKAIQKAEHKIKIEREEQIQQFRNQIRSAETDIQIYDGQLSKTYSIAYTNRRKYDFVKNAEIKATYADN